MRIGIDGERGFCFGVDDNWRPLSAAAEYLETLSSKTATKRSPEEAMPAEMLLDPQAAFFRQTPFERAAFFFKNTAWAKLLEQLRDAGLLKKTFSGSYEVCVERTVGLLVLTAIHDIMKVDVLLPTVQPQHAPYDGFQVGDRINDHDLALGYVLEHFGSALPSFVHLPPAMQRTIRFTQSKLAFNHGWLVQGEAPPGALFCKFKQTILNSDLAQGDVAFYFVHWLTDLSGAEPTPLRGCEKCVIKFPHAVLHSFISSFQVVNNLVNSTETNVFENYLLSRWSDLPQLGPPPTGETAITLMRLVVQVQAAPLQQRVAAAFSQLEVEDRETLCKEMALTGIAGQTYAAANSSAYHVGPAFLVYYSPAFLRLAARHDAVAGLRMLAEIYREARSLWPATASQQGTSVTIRVDQIKQRTPERIMDGHQWGECWQLVKRNELEGVVEQHPMYAFNEPTGPNQPSAAARRLLAFWRLEDEEQQDVVTIHELEAMRRRWKQNGVA